MADGAIRKSSISGCTRGQIWKERIDAMESFTFALVQRISDWVGLFGMQHAISESLILAFVIIGYAIVLFSIIVCLYLGHAQFMNLINRKKMKKGRVWIGNSKKDKRLNFEDQFDELFARS